ncbi:hypothetical protein ACX27_12990 [Nostoc piscinale CENA21]|uniref:DUF2834 domain-containing protein n=1 Tax=Nostoc piscinale CENA21 TaxID=224013 RepID=A0A0M4TUW7_9NOSO|nr:hypothetical protein [Nostoc piscinale]ALF53544.1 hypothetical protein ACX27_12990 [Nostoc piscinale CENA21]
MMKKLILWLIWVGFIAYIVFFAPPLHLEETLTLLKNILTFNLSAVNPIIVALFSLVGIWLLIYSGLLFIDGRMQQIPFWPFVLAAVGSGILGLLPYLALREPNQEFSGQKDAFLRLLDSRLFGIIVSLSTIVIVAYGLLGDWSDFVQQFQSDRFINGMSLAFCLFCVLFPTVLGDDMARRRWNSPAIFWTVSLIPLVGILAYLSLRPSLQTNLTQEFAVINR